MRKYLLANLERKVTIRELSEQFHISETQVKGCFKAAFGVTVHAWFRGEKMRAAAKELKETDTSILEIIPASLLRKMTNSTAKLAITNRR